MQNKINTTNKHLHRNSIFTILFVVILILVSSINTIPSNAAKATYIKKTKTFTISGCASGSTVQLYCQVDDNTNLSGTISGLILGSTYDVDTGKSAAVVTWKTPDNHALGGTIKCSYHSVTDTWTIEMNNVNCFTYTPYIICNAGTRTGYHTSTIVSAIAGNETGVDTNGDYNIVNLTATHQGRNTFKVYIGAGFADKGFKFNWVANKYTLKLNSNGGIIPGGLTTKSLDLTYGSTNYWSITRYNPTRTGYNFNGWYTANTGGTQVYGANGGCIPGTKYFDSSKKCCWNAPTWSKLNVYAHWTPKVSTITLDRQGGIYGTSAFCVKYNTGKYTTSACTTALPKVTIPTRTGYTFKGYYSKANGSGEKIITETGAYASIFTNKKYIANTTLYAYWTPNPYTITTQHMKYNPETKDWELWKTTTETANYDTTYTVKYITPETGYFEFSKPSDFVVKGNTTVQAKYHPKTYNLKLDYAGGLDKDDDESTTDIITWIYGTADGTDISEYTLTKEGYTFDGWYIDDTKVYDINDLIVKGTEYFNNEGKCILDSVNGKYFNLTAHWTVKTYNLKLDYAGGLDKDDKDSTTDTIKWIYGTAEGTDISDYTLTKEGYTFNGWYIDDTKVYDINDLIVKGTEYFNNEGKCILDSVNGKYFNLTAHWTAQVYTITLDRQGGINGTPAFYVKYNTGKYTTSACTTVLTKVTVPTRTGYTFKGYYSKTNGSGEKIITETGAYASIFTNTKYIANTTLYAYWTPNNYNIKFDYNYSEIGYETDEEAHLLVNGKSDIIEEKEVVYDTEVGVLPIPSILGANYIEWNTSADGSGKKYTSETIYKNAEDITLYAIWKKINFTLTYETNYIDKENSVYTIKDLISNEKIILKTCKELNFGVENTERTVHGDDKNYVIIPGDNFYYVSGDKYYRFVGYSIDKEAQHTCTNILNYAGQDIEGYELHYIYQAYENVKDDLSKDIKERNDKIKEEYERLKSINAPITEYDVTLYAIWDEYPILTLNPEALYQETVRDMTVDEFGEFLKDFINKDLTTDKEDNDYSHGKLSITFPNLAAEKKGMEELYNSGAVSVTYELKDTYGNITRKTKSIAIISKNPEDPTDPDSPNPHELTIRYYTRCINEFYYNRRYEIIEEGDVYDDTAARVSGGLAPMSKWYIKPEYVTEITECFNILKTDTGYEQVWTFTHEDMLEVQKFIKENGIGKTKSETALKDFYNKFKHLSE